MRNITIKNKTYTLPIYLPDATRAVVKSLDSSDLKEAHVEGAVVNTLHLAETPGLKTLERLGGIKKFMNFEGLITSDSGGWQVFSLIHRSNSEGTITDEGVVFKVGTKRKEVFTPEQSIQTQFEIGSDIIVCLDDFTSPSATTSQVKESVNRTIHWAERSKKEYLKIIKERNIPDSERPWLLAPVQGGWDKELRKECAQRLIAIGFDAYGYGGYTVENGGLNMEISEYLANLLPTDSVKFALGTGKPWEIVQLYKMGWDIFDCTLPTRDARHERLYVFNKKVLTTEDWDDRNTFGYIDIGKTVYATDQTPIDPYCDCHTCRNFTRAYLHHLFKIKDSTALRLASIHNLRHYTKVVEVLRKY